MKITSKKIILILAVLGLAVFILFAFPNATGAKSEAMLADLSTDEPITYPIVVRMLTPTESLRGYPGRLIFYGDYHYGYPFYVYSTLAMLPVRLIFGEQFTNYTQLNLWLLRQMVSVLPMILAVAVMVFLQTRFRSPFWAALLFVLMFTVRGISRNNIDWWHPDAMAVLAVALAIFFLERDRLRFGRDFFLAAVMCGLATAIKLVGVFFFLTIFGYLAVGFYQRRLNWKKLISVSAFFVVVMAATVALSNPFLYDKEERQDLIDIQTIKSHELSNGYNFDDPSTVQKGPQYWEWTLRKWYGYPLFLGLIGLSLVAGCIWGPNRRLNLIILSWVVPYSIYLLWFVAVKPDHYWLPVMVPYFSASLNLVWLIQEWGKTHLNKPVRLALVGLIALALAAQTVVNFSDSYSGLVKIYRNGMTQEIGY